MLLFYINLCVYVKDISLGVSGILVVAQTFTCQHVGTNTATGKKKRREETREMMLNCLFCSSSVHHLHWAQNIIQSVFKLKLQEEGNRFWASFGKALGIEGKDNERVERDCIMDRGKKTDGGTGEWWVTLLVPMKRRGTLTNVGANLDFVNYPFAPVLFN